MAQSEMGTALDAFRQVVAHPTLKGLCAALAAVWAAFWNEASTVFLVTIGFGLLFGALDTLLGSWRAYIAGSFTRRGWTRFVSKFLSYSALWFLALGIGAVVDAQTQSQTIRALYAMPAAMAAVLIGTEGLSIVNHIDALQGGQLSVPLAFAQRLLGQIRQERESANTQPTRQEV